MVFGGGPATRRRPPRLALARSGRSVVVLEQSRYESMRIGETLPPEIQLPLSELGVWERFLADAPSPSPGIIIAWGRPKPHDNDFLWNPFGSGWHIDRRRFDAMLATAAEAEGVELFRAARLTAWDRTTSENWWLRGVTEAGTLDLHARVLIDATGRAASPIRRLGGGRIVHDRLAGLVAFVRTERDGSWDDQRTLIEATEDGWWYTAPLPGSRQVAAFMTDADLLPTGGIQRVAYWHEQLEKVSLARARLFGGRLESDLRVVTANCSRLRGAAGEGWLAAGDAAAALDPLSSQGVYRALLAGLSAARAIDDHLQGVPGVLAEYAHDIEMMFAADLQDWAEYYGRERRWRDAPFWRRRSRSLDR